LDGIVGIVIGGDVGRVVSEGVRDGTVEKISLGIELGTIETIELGTFDITSLGIVDGAKEKFGTDVALGDGDAKSATGTICVDKTRTIGDTSLRLLLLLELFLISEMRRDNPTTAPINIVARTIIPRGSNFMVK
jgi:hypothetical protein